MDKSISLTVSLKELFRKSNKRKTEDLYFSKVGNICLFVRKKKLYSCLEFPLTQRYNIYY